MKLEEQEALLELWTDFLDGQAPTPAAMREFYFEVVAYSGHYRYGMAPEVFDLLIHGVFDVERASLWALGRPIRDGHRANSMGRPIRDGHRANPMGRPIRDGHRAA